MGSRTGEVIISLILHPLAVLRLWIRLAERTDLTPLQKAVWAVVGLLCDVDPLPDLLVRDGHLW